MTLDQIFDHGKQTAEHLFKAQGGIHPMWICEAANGQIIPICIEMPERTEREALASALKDTFKRHDVQRYVAVIEAWAVETAEETKDLVRGYKGSLKDHPDRREVLFVTAEDVNGESIAGRFYILRPEQGQPQLSPFTELQRGRGGGVFSRLLSTEH